PTFTSLVSQQTAATALYTLSLHDALPIFGRDDGRWRPEGAITIAHQHGDVAPVTKSWFAVVGHGEVGHPVAVEIARGDGHGTLASPEGQWRLEGAIAVAQQHRDGASRPQVGDRQIRMPVAVEVAHGQGSGARAGREGDWLLEGPMAFAQQHRDGVGKLVGDRQVRMPVAVEVAHGDGSRTLASTEGPCFLEGP